jgi:hypothetical protein
MQYIFTNPVPKLLVAMKNIVPSMQAKIGAPSNGKLTSAHNVFLLTLQVVIAPNKNGARNRNNPTAPYSNVIEA